MDIIDIMLARAMTPQGQTDIYVNKANSAAAKAEKAKDDAENAVATVEAAAETIATTQESADTLLASAREALETAQAAQINTLDEEDVDTEVNKMSFNLIGVSTQSNYTQTLTATMPDGTTEKNITGIAKLYKTTGSNEDGSMTQKAITDALGQKADASTAATKTYVDEKFASVPAGGSGNTYLGDENEGKIVIVGSDGNITSGTVSEEELITSLINGGGYTARNAVGLEVDYDNKSFTRVQLATGKTKGSDFDAFLMYGGRKRCNVADNGTINAFYGENGYTEDGSNGQVMVYQPKFYYQRVPINTLDNKVGRIVTHDSFIISTTAQSGFKVHPVFVTPSGEELDYVLFSAYEGSLYDTSANNYVNALNVTVDFGLDKLSSISNAKPITGSSGLSLAKAEQLANNRGTGWHIQTMAAESANQMLEIIEFGTMNGQSALGAGVCNLAVTEANSAALTGATASLGNVSGVASSTTLEANGSTTITTDADKSSISYRGVENPWGNVWQMLGGITISGNAASNGGVPYICKNYNYVQTTPTSDYESVGFSLPNTSSWISAMGYGSKDYDWVIMPAECASGANSALPVGDNGWYDANLSGIRMVVQGGGWSFSESDGLFYYGCDRLPTDSTYKSYGSRLLYIPTKNSIYTANIAKWQQEMNMGG